MKALFELGGAVNIWLSPSGRPYTCRDHADWAASQVLKVTLPPHSHDDVEAAKAYYTARGKVYERMFKGGWMRIAIQHDSKMLLTDGPRGTEAQWEWIYEKAGEDKLRVTDDQQNTIIDYRSNVQEAIDPDDPERYVRDIGTTFGDWLKVQGFILTNSDAVVDDFRIDGYISDEIPRSLRVIHFKDKVDYAGKPRGEWMLMVGGTTKQDEGDEGTIRGDVEYYLRHMGFVRSVPEAMVEVLLAEADPDDLDASAYMQQTFDLEDMFRSLGYQYGKAWPMDKMLRWYRQFIFDQPVDFSFGTPQNPRFIPVRGVVVYNFDKAGLRYSGLGRLERIEMAVGWLAGESCSPQENMDVNAGQLFPALARMTHALEQWNKNFTTKNKTPEVVEQEVKEAVRAARMSQYDKSAWMAAREQHLRDATARLGEAEEPHTISQALRQGKDYYAPTMSPTLKVKFNVTPHPNRKGSGRSGWRKNRQLPPMPPKMEAADPDDINPQTYLDALPQMEADFPMWLKAQGFREDPAWRERGAEIDVWRKPGVMKSGTRFTMGSQAEIVVRNVKTGGKDVWQAQFYGPVTWGGPWGGTPTELRNYISTWLSRHMESGVQSCPRCQGVGTLNESWCECCDGTGVVTPERVKAFEHEAIV